MARRGEAPEGFTVYWTREKCDALPTGGRRPRLKVLFGGHHQSQPSFLRMDVRPGDLVFPVTVRDRALLILGSMEVTAVQAVTDGEAATAAWAPEVAEWLFLATGHVDEIVRGRRGTPLRLDRRASASLLAEWTYCSNKGTRALRHVEGDTVSRTTSFDQIYRLDRATRDALRALTETPLKAL